MHWLPKLADPNLLYCLLLYICTGWKESIGHGSKLKGFLAHIYADLTDLT